MASVAAVGSIRIPNPSQQPRVSSSASSTSQTKTPSNLSAVLAFPCCLGFNQNWQKVINVSATYWLLEACKKRSMVLPVPRRNIIASLVSSFVFSQLGPHEVTLADPSFGFREHIDIFDGYSFLYPKNWIQVRGAGADIFFRDPFVLDENISMELSSPSSSRYKSVEDLGTPQAAAEKVLTQYLTEFMSTRLGVRREANILTSSSRVADDGKVYYQVEVNIKSYASNNELAVMPQDRIQGLEWDRRYLSVLGVGNNRLYELRLQTPENVFLEEEKELRQIMDSFRVLEAVN